MKAILEFNLPEDQSDLDVHNKASELRDALYYITDDLHRRKKHGDPDLSQEQCDKLYSWFLAVLDDYDIGPLVRG